MITMVNPWTESFRDAFSFRGPGSVPDDFRMQGPFVSAFAGYYFTRVVATLIQMAGATRMGSWLTRLGALGAGIIQIFLGRTLVNQFPTLFARDAFVGGLYVGVLQGAVLPWVRTMAPDNRFLNYLSGAWDTGDFGGSYGAVPQLPMAGEMWQGAYGEQEQPLGTAYYEDTTVSGPVPSGYDNAQLDAGYDDDMLYANMQ